MLNIFRFHRITATIKSGCCILSTCVCVGGGGFFTMEMVWFPDLLSFRISSIKPIQVSYDTYSTKIVCSRQSTHTVVRFYSQIDFNEFARLSRLHCRPFVGPFHKKPIRRPFLFDNWMEVDRDCANHLASTQTSRRARFYSRALISSPRELFNWIPFKWRRHCIV